MDNFLIVLDKIGETYFPDDEWTDMGYPVLCIWAENLLSCREQEYSKFRLYFMDGPYYIDVEKKSDTLFLEGICEKNIRRCCFSFECSYSNLLSEVLSSLLRLRKIVQRAQCDNRLREEIIAAVDHYKKEIRRGTSLK